MSARLELVFFLRGFVFLFRLISVQFFVCARVSVQFVSLSSVCFVKLLFPVESYEESTRYSGGVSVYGIARVARVEM